MVKVEISTDTRYPVDRSIIRQAVLDALKENSAIDVDSEVSVAVVGKRKMEELCRKYLDDKLEHEVLSFPYEDLTKKTEVGFISSPDGVLRLGDIVLCWPFVLAAASRDNLMVSQEVRMLVMHSVCHLLGKHHE